MSNRTLKTQPCRRRLAACLRMRDGSGRLADGSGPAEDRVRLRAATEEGRGGAARHWRAAARGRAQSRVQNLCSTVPDCQSTTAQPPRPPRRPRPRHVAGLAATTPWLRGTMTIRIAEHTEPPPQGLTPQPPQAHRAW